MKKTVQLSFIYAILAMVGGVFYREFTKFNQFQGTTSLSLVHTHFFMLGMLMMLIVTLFIAYAHIDEAKRFKTFMYTYNSGLIITAIMLFVRGFFQVTQPALSNALNASISGIAGIGHALLGIGIVCFFLSLKEKIKG